MNERIREELEERILNDFEKLKSESLDEKKRSEIMEDLNRLYRLKLEEDKNDMEWEKHCKKQEANAETINENKIDRWVKIGIAGAELVLPLAFYAFWMGKGFKFEETGTYSSPTFKGLIKFFKPRK